MCKLLLKNRFSFCHKGGFGLKEKTKAVCGLGRIKLGGLRNVRPPIIDPPNRLAKVDQGLVYVLGPNSVYAVTGPPELVELHHTLCLFVQAAASWLR